MPTNPIDYQKTIIYKIVCDNLNITDIYVGATTDMIRRKAGHKKCCNNPNNKHYNFKIYQSMRKNGGFNNWKMLEVEKYPCNNKAESAVRERYWLEFLSANLNKLIPSRTQKEYNNDHKEQISEREKIYREANQEKIKDYMKEHYELNKETIINKSKEYNNINKDKIRERASIKYDCICGGKYTHEKKLRHNSSKKHLLYLSSLNTTDI